MGYTHYIKLDEPLTEEQASRNAAPACARTCGNGSGAGLPRPAKATSWKGLPADGTAGQQEAPPKQATLFQSLSGSAESIQQDAGAFSDASDDLLEAAQCLWEAVLPRAVPGGGFDDVAGELGMAELRGRMREPALLAACLEGWQTAEERHYDGAFDWGYVPLFLETCIDPKDAALVPGWQAKLAEALEREGNPASSPLPDGD